MREMDRGGFDEDPVQTESSSSPVGQVFVEIPGLRPEKVNSAGKVIGQGNLRNPRIWKNASQKELQKLKEIFNKNRKAGKTIRAKTILGGILLTVAVTGYELGPAHGRHVRPYLKLMKQGLVHLEEIAKKQGKSQ